LRSLRKASLAGAARRHRGYASARLECENLPPRKPRNPENEQAALAYLQRALARRLSEVKGTRPAND
jgi:hypothetical protein